MTRPAAHTIPFPSRDAEFVISVRVYYQDTDLAGVVYHSVYLDYLERARSDWLRALGYGHHALVRQFGLLFPVRSLSVEYRKPAAMDDLLSVSVRPREATPVSLSFVQQIRRADELLLRAQVKVAPVDAKSFRLSRIPQALQELFFR